MARRQPTPEDLAELRQRERDLAQFRRDIGLDAPLVSDASDAADGAGGIQKMPVRDAPEKPDVSTVAQVQDTDPAEQKGGKG